ncbi:hypothetical protein, partial [Streptomyces altiplanensis]
KNQFLNYTANTYIYTILNTLFPYSSLFRSVPANATTTGRRSRPGGTPCAGASVAGPLRSGTA